MRRGDWMKFNCGDEVYDEYEPRHLGTVQEIHNGEVRVRWANGWREDLPLARVRHARPRPRLIRADGSCIY